MEKVTNYIQEQLLRTGELNLPGLGKFLLHDYRSSINKYTKDARLRGSTIHFEYNENAKAKEALPIYITDFATLVKDSLKDLKTFSAGVLGNFFTTSAGNITFLSSPKINLSKETFGFTQIRVDDTKKDWLDWLNEPQGEEHLPELKEEIEKKIPKQEIIPEVEKPVEEKLKVEVPLAAPKTEVELPKETIKVETPKVASTDSKVVKLDKVVSTETATPKVKKEVKGITISLILRTVASLFLLAIATGSVYFSQELFLSDLSATPIIKVETPKEDPKDFEVEGKKIETTAEEAINVSIDKEKAQIMAEVILLTRKNLAKLSKLPGNFYVVGGTFATENIALNQCMRWERIGQQDVACGQVKGSQLYKILIARFADSDDARIFAKQIVQLDGNPLRVQELNIEYPE